MSRRSGKAWAAKEATQKINSISKRRMRGSLNDDSELIIFRQSGTELFNNQYTTPAFKIDFFFGTFEIKDVNVPMKTDSVHRSLFERTRLAVLVQRRRKPVAVLAFKIH